MSPPNYHITAVKVVRHGILYLTFADGLRGEVDLSDQLRGPVFARARTPAGFAEVAVDPDIGTITWPAEPPPPGAEETTIYKADFAPDTLYERVRTGAWPPSNIPA